MRREAGGILFQLVLGLVVVFALGALAWMLFLPLLLTRTLAARTGFEVTVERLTANPFTGTLEARGLVLANPRGFAVRDFLEVRELRANVRMGSLWSEPWLVDSLLVDIATVTLVKRADGVTNVDAWQQAAIAVSSSATAAKPAPPARPSWRIGELTLRVERLVTVDAAAPAPGRAERRLDFRQTYHDVADTKQLWSPELRAVLGPVVAGFGGLVPADPGGQLNAAVRSGTKQLEEAGRKTEAKVKGFFEALEEKKKP